MRKPIIFVVVGAFAVIASKTAVADDWTGSVNIRALRTTRLEATSSVSISGTCVSSQYAYLSPDEDDHEVVMSMLLAALLANKPVKLYCSTICASGDRCKVLNASL